MDEMEEIAFAGVAAQARMVRDREVSPTQLVELCLERIERLDPKLNSFNVVLAEQALAEARDAGKRGVIKAGGPLHGVPIAVKDNMDVAGLPTSHGTSAFPEVKTADCEAVRRLRAAGAIVIGKTTCPELSIYGFTESKTFGDTRNPWDTDRTPAGSSGGSAAAVAAGLVAGATASDGAGSIRWPAACTGLFGLKPQRGRVTLSAGDDAWYGLSMHGYLTRSVLDTALLLDATSANALGTPPNATAPPAPARPFAEAAQDPPRKLRIAWSQKAPRAAAPPLLEQVGRDAVSDTVELLRSLGHELEEVDPQYGMVGNNSMARYLRGIADTEVPLEDELSDQTKGVRRLGRLVPDRELKRARGAEAADRDRIGAVFSDHDLLLTPMLGVQPVEIGRWHGKGALRTVLSMSRVYATGIVWNHTGQPAASIPAGFDSDGLPRSVQLISRPNDEETLISLAAQIESERNWTERRPPVS